MKAVFDPKKLAAIKKARLKQARKLEKAKLKEAKKQKEKKRAQAKKRRLAKEAREAAGPVPVKLDGCGEVEMEVSWAERSNDKTIPQVRGTYERLPIKLGAEAGAVLWKLDKQRLQTFIKCEQDPKMVNRFKDIKKEARKLGLLC